MSKRCTDEDLKQTVEALEKEVTELRLSRERLLKESQALEESLRWNETRWRMLLAFTSDAITVIRLRDGRYTHVNEAFSRLTGYRAEEVIGRTALDLDLYVHSVDRDQLLQRLRQRGRVEGLEIRFRIKDWTIRDDLVSASLIRFQGEGHVICVSKSVTSLDEAQKAHRESEEKYRLLVENSNEGIFITQDDGIKFPNPRTKKLTEYSGGELGGMPFLNLVHSGDRDLILEAVERTLEGELRTNTTSLRIIDRKGDTLWV